MNLTLALCDAVHTLVATALRGCTPQLTVNEVKYITRLGLSTERSKEETTMTKASTFLATLIIATASLAAPIASASGGADASKTVNVIIGYSKSLNHGQANQVTKEGADIKREFNQVRMRAVTVHVDEVEDLRKHPHVAFVVEDKPIDSHSTIRPVSLSAVSTRSNSKKRATYIRSRAVQNTVSVAVIDSGVANHPDLDVKARLDCFWGSNALSIVSTTPCVNAIDNDVTGTFADNFESENYANSDGSSSWLGSSWIEFGDDGNASSGDIEIRTTSSKCFENGVTGRNEDDDEDNEGSCLAMLEADDGDWVGRSVGLKKAATAFLTFDYKASFDDDDGAFVLDISTDGGTTWKNGIAVFDTDSTGYGEAVELTPYLTGETMFRFRVEANGDTEDMRFIVDNLSIAVEGYDSYDPFGHGTHVAGMISSTGASSGNMFTGVAPGTPIYSMRVFDEAGIGYTSDAIAAMDFLLQHGNALGIRVVNLSIGKALLESNEVDPLVIAAEQLWDAGFVVVTSAGNFGRDGNFTITSPGHSRKLITVGSLTDNGTPNDFSDDYVSTYSSRGPTLIDHVVKPDLIAPGNRVISTTPGQSRLKRDIPDRPG